MSHSTCLVCGKPFKGRKGGKPQRYCTKECYREAKRARSKEWGRAHRKGPSSCEACGAPTRRYGRRAWCPTPECQRERNRRLSAEKYARDPDRQRAANRETYRRVGSAGWDKYRKARVVDPAQAAYTTPAKIEARFAYYGHRCWLCGGKSGDLQRDHVKPLSKAGAHLPANIRPACESCNKSKGNRWPFVST